MNKKVFICPYFGTLPKDHMSLFLQSCRYNRSFEWLIITDDETKYDYPGNVKMKYMSWNDCKKLIQSKFDFPILLNRPYKLCDFKPAYGFIFSDLLVGYDYWGYCDLSDSIFGNLEKFLTNDMLEAYEKIGVLGHLTIFKNTQEVNNRFMIRACTETSYKEIFASDLSMNFDELGKAWSINSVYRNNNWPIGRIDDIVGDIHPDFYQFTRAKYDEDFNMTLQDREPRFYRWVEGRILEYTKQGKSFLREEIAYIHLQRRKMLKCFPGEKKDYLIVPNSYEATDEIFDAQAVFDRHRWNNLFYAPTGCDFWMKLNHIRGNFSEWTGIRAFLKKRRDRRREMKQKK